MDLGRSWRSWDRWIGPAPPVVLEVVVVGSSSSLEPPGGGGGGEHLHPVSAELLV